MSDNYALMLIALSFSLTACAGKPTEVPPEPPKVLRSSADPLKLDVRIEISSSRQSAAFSVKNTSRSDVVCDELSGWSIYDNPKTYLEVGESGWDAVDVFLRPGETFSVNGRDAETMRPGSHVRAAYTTAKRSVCRRAKVKDFCELAAKSSDEQSFLLALMEQRNVFSCSALAEVLDHAPSLDVRRIVPVTSRPVIYLEGVQNIVMDESVLNRRVADEIVENGTSALVPTIKFETRVEDGRSTSMVRAGP